MIYARSLRLRMMLLFCAVVGVLLAGSHLAIYALLSREVHIQLDRQLQGAARPIIADLVSDPNEEDVNELNLPDEYFELLDPSGRVLQRSMNLRERPLDLGGAGPDMSRPVFRTVNDPSRGRLRLALIPFRRGTERRGVSPGAPPPATAQGAGGVRRGRPGGFSLPPPVVGAASGGGVRPCPSP